MCALVRVRAHPPHPPPTPTITHPHALLSSFQIQRIQKIHYTHPPYSSFASTKKIILAALKSCSWRLAEHTTSDRGGLLQCQGRFPSSLYSPRSPDMCMSAACLKSTLHRMEPILPTTKPCRKTTLSPFRVRVFYLNFLTLATWVDVILAAKKTIKPRPPNACSIPGLIKLMQDEWDALMLETYQLKKSMDLVS